jgi:hypothetical protein
MTYRAKLQDSDEFVFGAYLFHKKNGKHIIIEPEKRTNERLGSGLTLHLVKGETVGMELSVWCHRGFVRKKFYSGDIVDEGDNFPSIVQFGENSLNGYGFYLEETATCDGESQPRRHLINAYTSFPDETKVIGHVWSYEIDISIVPTPDGDFVCRNKYEVETVLNNLERLHPGTGVEVSKEKWTISKLDNSFATDMSVEYFKETVTN